MAGITTGWIATEMASRGYTVRRGWNAMVSGGSADSRTTEPGQLFTAFRGESVDGNDYVEAAIARGAVAIICERAPETVPPHVTVVVAPGSVRAVGELARAWRHQCDPRVVGITGTVGKTTAKELTAAALSQHFRVHKSPGNLNSLEGLPLALMSLWAEHEVSVLELAMDRPGEIRELCELVEPEVGVVLNIGYTHASKLGSIEAIAEEKLSLARWLPSTGVAVMNMDDSRVAAGREGLACRSIGFGSGADADLLVSDVEDLGLEGTRFGVTFEGESVTVRSSVPGVHTIPAALAAIGSGLALGLSLRDAGHAVSAAKIEGRMQVRRAKNGATILDDRYNASPASMAGALRLLAGRPAKRIALLGKMAELGSVEAEEHRRIGELAASCCDVLAAEGEPCRDMVDAAQAAGMANARWFSNRDDAAAYVASILAPGDTVLLKASRSQAFENIIPVLEGVE